MSCEDKNNKTINWKYISLVLIGLIVGVIIGSLLYKTNKNKNDKLYENDKPVYTSIKSKEKIDTVLKELNNQMDIISNKSIAFEVLIGESLSDYYLYNKDGECISQSSDGEYTTIFNRDGKSVKSNTKDNTITINSSIDVLTPCKRAIELLENGDTNIELIEVTYNSYNSNNIKEYIIDVKGYDNVKYLYSTVGEDFATIMVDSLEEYVGEDWIPQLQFGYIYSTSGELGLYCNVIIDNKEYLNWACDSYNEFIDWKLSDDWYTLEITSNNSQSLYDLMQKDLDTLNNNMESVIEEE